MASAEASAGGMTVRRARPFHHPLSFFTYVTCSRLQFKVVKTNKRGKSQNRVLELNFTDGIIKVRPVFLLARPPKRQDACGGEDALPPPAEPEREGQSAKEPPRFQGYVCRKGVR
eukprot:SAG11_NODE_1864_length_4154_cov_1.816769_6_plen_115_part_00